MKKPWKSILNPNNDSYFYLEVRNLSFQWLTQVLYNRKARYPPNVFVHKSSISKTRLASIKISSKIWVHSINKLIEKLANSTRLAFLILGKSQRSWKISGLSRKIFIIFCTKTLINWKKEVICPRLIKELKGMRSTTIRPNCWIPGVSIPFSGTWGRKHIRHNNKM